jgi:hypothetical protein
MAGERFSVASLELQLQARAAFVPVLRDRVRVWLEDAGTGTRSRYCSPRPKRSPTRSSTRLSRRVSRIFHPASRVCPSGRPGINRELAGSLLSRFRQGFPRLLKGGK